MKLQPIVDELWNSTPGKVGLILLIFLILVSIIVVITYPANFGSERWSNPALWADNPRSAPPAWTNVFTKEKRIKHTVVDILEPTSSSSSERAYEYVYETSLDFKADEPPTFLSLSISNVIYNQRSPIIAAVLHRPDDSSVVLYRKVISAPRRGEEAPYSRHESEPLRAVLGSEDRTIDDLIQLYETSYNRSYTRQEIRSDAEDLLFGRLDDDGSLKVLNGLYRFEVTALTNHVDDKIGSIRVVVGGSVFGAMGTDSLGRNLAEGLLFGLPVALLIGISTATVSTLIGILLGMISGYRGGKIDIVIQRAADIVANIPVLPLLIFLVFIGGSRLWLILMVLVAFSWPGLTIMVRTMVLQLRTGQEVESTRALGASNMRIMFRHILPHAASYILAQLVFFAPSAILAEAGLSFLGLGDPSIPTWGQILEYGFRTGAVFLGYWWWVIPPGLLIVLTAVTFMFLALGLEPAVDPRLRGKRAWHF